MKHVSHWLNLFKEKSPENLEWVDVILLNTSQDANPARAAVKRWSPRESFFRGLKLALKWVFLFFILPLPFAFLEPFLFMVWGAIASFILIFGVGPFLHFKFWSESVSFFFVEGKCPYCQRVGALDPYLSKRFTPPCTVHCPGCGETVRVEFRKT